MNADAPSTELLSTDLNLKEMLVVCMTRNEQKMSSLVNGLRNELQGKLDDHTKSIEYNSNQIEDLTSKMKKNKSEVKKEIKTERDNVTNLRTTITQQAEELTKMTAELEKMKQKVSILESQPGLADTAFPTDRTLVMQHVRYHSGEDLKKVVRAVLREGMLLNDIKIIDCMRMKIHENGKGLVKVQLESPDVLKRCTTAGKNLNKSEEEDLRCIYVRGSMTKAELAMDRGNRTLIRHLGLQHELKTTSWGQIVPNRSNRANRSNWRSESSGSNRYENSSRDRSGWRDTRRDRSQYTSRQRHSRYSRDRSSGRRARSQTHRRDSRDRGRSSSPSSTGKGSSGSEESSPGEASTDSG